MNKPKFVVFVDHLAEYNNCDCYVELEGKTILEAISSFEEKFDTYLLNDRVYLYKMMQKIGNTSNYRDILINRGHGWNIENCPIELNLNGRILESYNNN